MRSACSADYFPRDISPPLPEGSRSVGCSLAPCRTRGPPEDLSCPRCSPLRLRDAAAVWALGASPATRGTAAQRSEKCFIHKKHVLPPLSKLLTRIYSPTQRC